MSKAPLVSIIIPVYNAKEYLAQSLDCAINQKYRRLEVIVVDDGSTDESNQIIEEFASKDSRIISTRIENQGPSVARNTGIDMANGSFITFLDADDLFSELFLQRMISQISGADVCVCKKVRWNQRTGKCRVDGWPEFYGTKEELRKVLFSYQRSMRGATGRLYKTSVIRENGVRFPEALHYGEDMIFNYEFFKYISSAMFIDEPLYTYRIHNNDSLSGKNHTFFLKQWHNQKKCMISTFGE